MFDILLSVCLAGGQVCAERVLPVATPSEAACRAAAPERGEDWASRLDLDVTAVRCVAQGDLHTHVRPLAVVEVARGVYVHRGLYGVPGPDNAGDLANLGFIVGDKAVAVIDAGTSRAVAERLYAAIRQRTDLPIRWLLLTHMHPDHTLGASLFREAGASVVGHPNLESALANRARNYETALARLLGPEAWLGTRLIGPDRTVRREELDLGGRVLLVEAHGLAHTDTDLTVLDRTTGTWFVGDLVFAEHTPALDGSILGWQALLDDMARRAVARIVPGHGPAVLDWPRGGDATRGYLAAITADARAAIARGEPMSTAIDHIGESQRADWVLFDAFNKRNATAAYKELEWE